MAQMQHASLPRNPSWSWGKPPEARRAAASVHSPPFALLSNDLIEKTHFRRSPQFSFGARHAYAGGGERPGTSPANPAVLGADHPSRRPGPASYSVLQKNNARLQTAPASSFSKLARGGAVPQAGEGSPGPAAYTGDATFLSAKLAF